MKWFAGETAGAILVAGVLAAGSSAAAQAGGDFGAGKKIYVERCISCHGEDGGGSPFMPGMPNLTDPAVMNKKTDEELLTTIADGREGTPMREWKSVLNEQDRKNVLSYIRSFPGAKSP